MQDDLKKLQDKIIQAGQAEGRDAAPAVQACAGAGVPRRTTRRSGRSGSSYFLNKYGPGLVDRLSDEMPLDMGIHWVITI